MKILYLCPDLGIPVLGRKGASVHVRELASAFQRGGHRIAVVAQMLVKSPWEEPASFDVPVIQVKPGAGVSAAVQGFKQFNDTLGSQNSFGGEMRRILYNQELIDEARRRFENDPPDFIYERASLYAMAGVALAKEFDVPLLVELNAPLAVEQNAYRGTGFGELAAKAEKWLLTQADAVLAVSSELKKHGVGLGVEENRIHVVPNGVNPALFKPGKPDLELRKRFQLNGAPVLGFVGGLRPWHGVEILPELLERVHRQHRGTQLIVVGDGPLRLQLQRDFAKRKLDKNVVFTGNLLHEEIPAIIRQFDLALAPYPEFDHSFYFSPLKLFEYMACGVPVVASDAGQISEVITHSKNGMLYPAGNLDALAIECAKLLNSARLRKSIGSAAAKSVADKFTWDRNAERVTILARTLIERHRN